jgi:hypothetical protein
VLSLGRLALARAHGLSMRDALPVPLALVALLAVGNAVERAELYVMAGIIGFSLLLWFARKRLPR